MKKLVYILIADYLLFVSYCYSQPVTLEWVKRYNEPSNMNDHTTSLALDKQGNVIVTGYCETSTQSTNIVTVKYSPSGAQQWVASFNYTGSVADEPHAMVIDTAGNIYVAGSCGSFLTQIYDCVLLKYNTSGTLLWSRGYGGFTGAFYSNDLIIDRLGNIYVVGTTNVPSGNSVFLLKYNSNGDTLWTRKYKEPGYDLNAGMSIAVDSSNNILIGGQCVVNVNYAGDCLLIKYTSTGNYLWSQIYNSGGVNTSDITYKVGIDNNGNVYGTGKANYYSDILTLKYNEIGINQWIRIYNGYDNGSDYGASLGIDLASNIYITGGSVGGPSFTSDFITIKYNSNGDSLWVRRYNGTGNGSDLSRDISLDDSSNVYIVGVSAGTTGNDVATIKYTSQGTQQWIMRYPGLPSQFFFGKKIAVDHQRNVYVIGDNSDSGTGIDYITIKYSQLVGLEPISKDIPKEFELYQNYPNPFNPSTKIKFDLPKSNFTLSGAKGLHARLVIYDILGREVAVLVDRQLKPGAYEVEWNAGNFASGIYFYRLIAGDFTDTKSMVLIK